MTGVLESWPAPSRVDFPACQSASTPLDCGFRDNGQVRRGAVDPSTGIFYFSTTATNSTGNSERSRHVVYGFDYNGGDPRDPWYAALIVTGNAASGGGQSGDFDFSGTGMMVFVTGGENNAYIYQIGALGTSGFERIPAGQPHSTVSFTGTSGGTTPGNGVGIAFGGDGYLYLTNNDGYLYQVNPTVQKAPVALLGGPGQLPALGSSGPTVDLATIPPYYPVTVSLVKNAYPWLLDSDGDTINDRFDLSISQGGTLLKKGPTSTCPSQAGTLCSGEIGRIDQVVLPGQGSLLIEQVERDDNDQPQGDLSKYATTLECLYVSDGVVVGELDVTEPDLTSPDSRRGVITIPVDSPYRNVVCTFTNLSALITVDSMPFTGGPLLGWLTGTTTALLLCTLGVALGMRGRRGQSYRGAGPP